MKILLIALLLLTSCTSKILIYQNQEDPNTEIIGRIVVITNDGQIFKGRSLKIYSESVKVMGVEIHKNDIQIMYRKRFSIGKTLFLVIPIGVVVLSSAGNRQQRNQK